MVRVPFILLFAPHRKGPHLCFLLPRQGAALEVSRIASSEGAAVRGAVGAVVPGLDSEAPLPGSEFWLHSSPAMTSCKSFIFSVPLFPHLSRGMMTITVAATSENVVSIT